MTPKITRYVVVQFSLLDAHIDDQAARPEDDGSPFGGNYIQDWIDNGWQPYGPPASIRDKHWSYQVMVRYAEPRAEVDFLPGDK